MDEFRVCQIVTCVERATVLMKVAQFDTPEDVTEFYFCRPCADATVAAIMLAAPQTEITRETTE